MREIKFRAWDKKAKKIRQEFSDEDTAIVVWDEKYSYFMAKPIQDYYFDNDVLGVAIEDMDVEIIRKYLGNS